MKKAFPVIMLCLMFFACREETIPVVSVQMLPEELVRLSPDAMFDTIPYRRQDTILRDTFYVDSLWPDTLVIESIEIDTLYTDTFYVDTFYIDTLRLRAKVEYAGEYRQGPTLLEYGFCVNNIREDDTVFCPVWYTDPVLLKPQRLTEEGREPVTNCHEQQLLAAGDGGESDWRWDGYGEFSWVVTARNTDYMYVYAYAVNPFGTVYSLRRLIFVADHDQR